MKTRMIRFRMDPDKEERWLNEQSARGFALCDAFMVRYTFEDTTPGKYVYRIVFLEKLYWTAEMRRYIQFIEETGAECVGAYGRWAYFRRLASDGPFEINSDIATKIKHYHGLMVMHGLLGFSQFCFFISRTFEVIADLHEGTGRFPDTLWITIAVLHGLICALLLTMFFRSWRRSRRLKKEMQIFE